MYVYNMYDFMYVIMIIIINRKRSNSSQYTALRQEACVMNENRPNPIHYNNYVLHSFN